MGKLLLVAAVLTALASFQAYKCISVMLGDAELTYTIPDTYWGPKKSEGEKEDVSVKPFSFKVDDKDLKLLQSKLTEELNSGRFTPPLEGVGFQYGFNHDYLKQVVGYWLNKYDWRSREKLLNQYPQFKTKISGLNIHFQHVKSKNNGKYKKTLPLLVLHGWPGSFVEHQKLIPFLTDPKDSEVNFELIVPSLPGYGFSDPARKPGMGPVDIAHIFMKLMKRLGHDQYYLQVGDWGAVVGLYMSTFYPQHVRGHHTNAGMSFHSRATLKSLGATFFPSLFLSAEEQERFAPMSDGWKFLIRESGYLHIQATKPDTVGAALLHSPTGLAAYILEKFSSWTNTAFMIEEDGALTKKFNLDELLDNIMIYWITNSIVTSQRLYSEFFGAKHFSLGLEQVPVHVPVGCIIPGKEGWSTQTESMVKETYRNLVQYTYAEDGGHFFSMEHPDVLARDFLSFVKKVEK